MLEDHRFQTLMLSRPVRNGFGIPYVLALIPGQRPIAAVAVISAGRHDCDCRLAH